MTPQRQLLDDADKWNADARTAVDALNSRRADLLTIAKRLKMLAAVKSLLVLPRVGEPAAPEAAAPPGPYPTAGSPADLADMPAAVDDLTVPAALRRK